MFYIKKEKYKISVYCPQDNLIPTILGPITDVTAHSTHLRSDIEQQNSTILTLHNLNFNLPPQTFNLYQNLVKFIET